MVQAKNMKNMTPSIFEIMKMFSQTKLEADIASSQKKFLNLRKELIELENQSKKSLQEVNSATVSSSKMQDLESKLKSLSNRKSELVVELNKQEQKIDILYSNLICEYLSESKNLDWLRIHMNYTEQILEILRMQVEDLSLDFGFRNQQEIRIGIYTKILEKLKRVSVNSM